jgi:hypothetical protein
MWVYYTHYLDFVQVDGPDASNPDEGSSMQFVRPLPNTIAFFQVFSVFLIPTLFELQISISDVLIDGMFLVYELFH